MNFTEFPDYCRCLYLKFLYIRI